MRKSSEMSRLQMYDRISKRGRLQGVPKGCLLLRAILEETSGRGLRPDRRPAGEGGGWYGLAEFLVAVPPLLRNYKDGETLDEVAMRLHMDSEKDLLEALRAEWRQKENREYYEKYGPTFEDVDCEPSYPSENDDEVPF